MAVREVVLVVQKGDHSLGYYDLATGQELARVAVDPFPHEFTLSPDGRRAYLASFGVALAEHGGAGGNTVAVVDLAGRQRVGTIDCGEYRRPHDVVCDAAGRAYILSEATSHLLVAGDPASGRFDHAIPTRGKGSHMVTVLRDGSLAFTSNMESGDVTALFPREPGRPGVVLPAGAHPEGSVLDAEEARLFVVNRESRGITVIDVKRLAVLETVATPPGPVRICRDPRGFLLVALYHGKGLLIVDERDYRRQRVVALPEKAISVGYHEASRTALLSTHAHSVAVVDADAGRLVRSIPTRPDPDPVRVVRLDV